MNGGAVHYGATNHVDSRCGVNRVETQRSQDEPTGKLTHIVVAGNAIGRIGVPPSHDFACQVLRFPSGSSKRVEVGDMIAGFLALSILADKTRDIRRTVDDAGSGGKQPIELGDEPLVASE